MSWRNEKQEASFRGVPFFCETDEQPVGQRAQVNEYPLRDMPSVQFLGKKAMRITMSAWVAGDDFLEKRDALLDALEAPGPGELVHPWFGRMKASAVDSSVSHSRKEQGMSRFSLVFIREEESETAPSIQQNIAATLGAELQATDAIFIDRFSELISSIDMLAIRADAVVRPITEIMTVISEIYGDVTAIIDSGLSVVDEIISAPSRFAENLLSFVRSASGDFNGFYNNIFGMATVGGIDLRLRSIETIKRVPMPISQGSYQFVAATKQLVERAILIDAMGGAAKFPSAGSRPSRLKKRMPAVSDNTIAQAESVDIESFAYDTLGVEYVPVPVADDIWRLRTNIGETVWSAMTNSVGEDYEALSSVRGLVLRHLGRVARGSSSIIEVKNPVPQPALVLSYRLFGDARRAAEIISRNQIIHPGFVPAKIIQASKE